MGLSKSSSGQYSANKNKSFKISMLRSDLCDYSNECIVVKEKKDLLAPAANENDQAEKVVAFKNKAPFSSCILKTNSTLIENAEELDIVMPMYHRSEYSQNF